MKKSAATREELLLRVRDLEQRLVEANSIIEALQSRAGAEAGELAASQQTKQPGQQLAEELGVANEELQVQAEELQQQNEELQAQAEELEMQQIELRRLYEELEEDRALLHTVLEQMPAGVVIAEAPSGKFLLVNRQMETVLACSLPTPDKLENYTHFQGFHPDALPFGHGDYPLARALTIGQNTFEEEVHLNRGDGSPAIIQENAAPVRNRRGEIVAAVSTYRDITIRKQRERQILRFASFPQLNPSPVLEVDRSGQVIYYNGAALDAVRDLGGHAAISRLVPADLDEILLAFKESGQTVFERQVTIGDTVYLVYISDAELFDTYRLYAIDITERQRAENIVWRAKEDWERTFDAVPDLIAILDDNHRLVRVNRAMAQALGTKPGDLAGKFCHEVMHRLDRPHHLCPHSLLLKDGREHTAELHEMGLDLLVTAAPLHDQDGKLLGSVHVARDITAHKQAAAALRQSEEHYRSLFANMLNGYAYCRMHFEGDRPVDFTYLRVNRAFATLTGLTEVEGKKVSEVIPGLRETDPQLFEIYGRVASTGVPETFETYVAALDMWFAIAVYSPQKEHFVAVFDVITERKRAEAALRRSSQRLDLLAESAGKLLVSVEPQRVVDDICPKVMDFLGCDAFFNFLYDEKEGRLHLNAYAGIPTEEARRIEWLDYGVAVCGCAARDGCRIVAEDILHTPDPRTDLVKSYGIQAYACHPLTVGGKVLGTLSFGTRSRPQFTVEELSLMKAVADQVAIAMDRKLAEEALQRLNEELEQRVEARTEELVESVAQLEEEITDRQQAEQKLEAEHKRLFAVLESIPAHVFLLRPDHTISFANGEFVRRFGEPGTQRCYEIMGLATPCSECQAMAVFETGDLNVREWASLDGKVYQIYDYPFIDLDGSPLVLEMGIDITAANEAESQVQSLGRLYRLLSRVNEAIVRAQEPEGLFREACRIMMEEGDFLLCWIGRVDWPAGVVRAAAQYDLKEGYPNDITISLQDVPEGRGPTGVAVREARLDICQDINGDPRMEPWKEQALARGFHSSAAFPLFVGGQVEGVLTLYSGQTGFFNPEEVGLLNSLAQDLSFAMEAMDREAKRRQAEEEIRRLNGELEELVSELRKQANLLDLAHDAILVRDLDSRILYWNRGAEETYGWRQDEVLGQVTHNLLRTKFPCPLEEIDQTLIRRGQWDGELVHTRADGSVITLTSRQVLQTDEEDNPVAVLEINRDVTDRKRTEAALLRTHDDLAETVAQLEEEMNDRQRAELELARLNADLEQRVKERTAQLETANREMEAFTYSVSHDLKAPIRAIDGFSRILMQEHVASLDAEGLRLLEVVRHNTGFMAQLIEDLLALSRLGRREIRKAPLDLAQMTATAFQRIKEEYPDRHLDLSIKDLPAAFGDPSLMHQVLVNLLSNACKFTKFKENAAIEVGGWSEDGENVYYVKDDGVGFDMRYVNKLFGVFQRLHKSSDFEGTGVGLALVQRIIQRHGGRVWAEGQLDAGATFFFALPAT